MQKCLQRLHSISCLGKRRQSQNRLLSTLKLETEDEVKTHFYQPKSRNDGENPTAIVTNPKQMSTSIRLAQGIEMLHSIYLA